MLTEKCESCYYWSTNSHSCDFYLLTGIRRNPDKLEECPRYMEGRRKGWLSGSFDFRSSHYSDDECHSNGLYTAMESMYQEGYSDKQIADELGCSYHTVSRWRKRNNLPGNR